MPICPDCSESSQHRTFDTVEKYSEHREEAHGERPAKKEKPKPTLEERVDNLEARVSSLERR